MRKKGGGDIDILGKGEEGIGKGRKVGMWVKECGNVIIWYGKGGEKTWGGRWKRWKREMNM